MKSVPYNAVLLPGDGIGTEVMTAARTVLESALARHGVLMQLETIPCGGAYYHDTDVIGQMGPSSRVSGPMSSSLEPLVSPTRIAQAGP